jgi:dihydrolipoamide dehydrogenase
MEQYDLIVLGGGPGGYRTAERAAEEGFKTVLIEKLRVGGVCLNEGCIPTKAYLNSAKIYRHALEGGAFGVIADGIRLDHGKALEHKNKVVSALVSGVEAMLKSKNVTIVRSQGMITGKENGNFTVAVGDTVYAAPRLVLATGSEPVILPLPGVKEGLASGFVMTSREILDMQALPASLAVIGGGVIGLEMACYFATAGVKVTVIEMLDKIAGATDEDFCARLMKRYRKMGMEFKLSCKVASVGTDSVTYEDAGGMQTVRADKVLLSIGRRPVSKGIGLETIGVATLRGAVTTDDRMRTNIAGVYAVGDVNGKLMLAHAAYREADVAVNHMAGKSDRMRFEAVPNVLYTDPEVASVGDSVASAKAKGLDVRAVSLPMNLSGRYLAETERGDGLCKMVVENGTNRVVGAHLMGAYASEIIYGAAMMIETQLPVDTLREIVFPHPTVSEILREALFAL